MPTARGIQSRPPREFGEKPDSGSQVTNQVGPRGPLAPLRRARAPHIDHTSAIRQRKPLRAAAASSAPRPPQLRTEATSRRGTRATGPLRSAQLGTPGRLAARPGPLPGFGHGAPPPPASGVRPRRTLRAVASRSSGQTARRRGQARAAHAPTAIRAQLAQRAIPGPATCPARSRHGSGRHTGYGRPSPPEAGSRPPREAAVA